MYRAKKISSGALFFCTYKTKEFVKILRKLQFWAEKILRKLQKVVYLPDF